MALNQTESILMPDNDKRLIEVAFPLRQTSIDSVHEKNVRHGHISTLHIWPARRPMAACRAALIATLLLDPGDKEKRDEILKRLGGTLNKTLKRKKMPGGRVEEIEALETEGGVLHWGRETSPDMACSVGRFARLTAGARRACWRLLRQSHCESTGQCVDCLQRHCVLRDGLIKGARQWKLKSSMSNTALVRW